jgi:hypothetical protein
MLIDRFAKRACRLGLYRYLGPTMASYWEAVHPVVSAIRAETGNEIYLQHLGALISMLNDGTLFKKRSRSFKKHELKKIERRSKAAVTSMLSSVHE